MNEINELSLVDCVGVKIPDFERDALIDINELRSKARKELLRSDQTEHALYSPFRPVPPFKKELGESQSEYIFRNYEGRALDGSESSFMIKNNRVIGLRLFATHLPEIPSAISKLIELLWISFEINDFGSDPKLERLLPAKNLEILNLSGAFRTDVTELSEIIGQFKSLRFLDLRSTYFKTLPKSIGNLQNLTHLSLENSELKDLPNAIGNLKNLIRLNLRCNHLQSLPKTIGNLANLKSLNIAQNKLLGLPRSIGNLRDLETMKAYENELEILPNTIGNLMKLDYLDISDNNLHSLPDTLGHLKNLRTLELSHNHLECLPSTIGALFSLTHLFLENNSLYDLPESLMDLKNLRDLRIKGNQCKSFDLCDKLRVGRVN